MKLWIARDKSNQLTLHYIKPVFANKCWWSGGTLTSLDSNMLPEVTFENSPQRVELELPDLHIIY